MTQQEQVEYLAERVRNLERALAALLTTMVDPSAMRQPQLDALRQVQDMAATDTPLTFGLTVESGRIDVYAAPDARRAESGLR